MTKETIVCSLFFVTMFAWIAWIAYDAIKTEKDLAELCNRDAMEREDLRGYMTQLAERFFRCENAYMGTAGEFDTRYRTEHGTLRITSCEGGGVITGWIYVDSVFVSGRRVVALTDVCDKLDRHKWMIRQFNHLMLMRNMDTKLREVSHD